MPDWWSVGIVIYQLMNKRDPFDLVSWKSVEIIIKAIWNFTDEANKFYSEELKDLVKKLLTKDQTLRLGYKNDAAEILGQPIFKNGIISPDMVRPKADLYDLNQEFLDLYFRKLVEKHYYDRTDYEKEQSKVKKQV